MKLADIVLSGRKQAYRIEAEGTAIRDAIARHDQPHERRPSLQPVMRGGVLCRMRERRRRRRTSSTSARA
jgi:hypothetical protein